MKGTLAHPSKPTRAAPTQKPAMGQIPAGRGRFTPAVITYREHVHAAHPISVYIISRLNGLWGKAIKGAKGSNGAIRYGVPSVQTQRTNYKGYGAPQDMFLGWNPKKVARGHAHTMNEQLPYSNPPFGTGYTPLETATSNMTAGGMRLDSLGGI